ncbi:RNA polymerase subunit sigma-24 [Geodermatophilus sp. TF02-6]|nr:RNA polymerase subunit sigma-24 [Geodermatophilus sp. TF02-6]
MRAGDRGAVTELFDRFGRPAFTLARRILADDALAEDVLQQVFLGVWRDPGAYDRSRGSFSSWLLAVVHHGAVDAVRRGESQRRRPVRAEDDAGAAAPSSSRDAGGRRPAAQRVRAALGALPDDQREALALAYYGGYTQREVAALTRAPLGTVTSRMLAGMRRLAEELGGTSASSGGGAPIGGAGR